LFYAGKYYTQVVSTQDDPKFAAFALELARRVAARQKPGGSPAPAPTPVAASQPVLAPAPVSTAESTAKAAAVQPAANNPTAEVTPATYFKFLPAAVKTLTSEGADEMIVSSSIGLFDVVCRKGNTLAGANGATNLKPAEAYARSLAKTLPAQVQAISRGK